MDDDLIVERIRTAIDVVVDHRVPAPWSTRRPPRRPAVALGAIALIAAALVGALALRDRSDTLVRTTTPGTLPPSPSLVEAPARSRPTGDRRGRVALATATLRAGPWERVAPRSDRTEDGGTSHAWMSPRGLADGLVVMTRYPEDAGYTGARVETGSLIIAPDPAGDDGVVAEFRWWGDLDVEVGDVQPTASGTFTAPVPSFVDVEDSYPGGDGDQVIRRTYTVPGTCADRACSAEQVGATITIGETVDLYRRLTSASNVDDAVVAGEHGYRATFTDGSVLFLWRTADGGWGELDVEPIRARWADLLLAALHVGG